MQEKHRHMPRQLHNYIDDGTGIPARWNDVTERIIGCAIEVHRTLGPGLLERIYEDAMVYELSQSRLAFQRQVIVRVPYKDVHLSDLRIDILVEGDVIVELKALSDVLDAMLAQLVSYLRATSMPVGLLINFHAPRLIDGVFRRVCSSTPRPIPPSSTSAFSATSAFKPC
jgi:GxxExxY protein